MSRAPRTKKELELLLSKLPKYSGQRRELEQYFTPPRLAAHIAWIAYLKGDVGDATIVDLGCGDGRLLASFLLMGGKRGVCVEIDEGLLAHAKRALSSLLPFADARVVFVNGDATRLEISSADIVVMNPPFGIYRRNRGADLAFLDAASRFARAIYSIHKYNEKSRKLIEEVLGDRGFLVDGYEVHDFEIPMAFPSHRRKIYRIKTMFIIARRSR